MEFFLDTKNMNYSVERFLKWIANHPERHNAYLNRQLKDIEIVVTNGNTYLYGDDHHYICLNNCAYSKIKNTIDLPELIDEGIIKDPIFVIQSDYAEDSYTVEQYIVGITDNYDNALAILKKHPYPTLNITKRNQPIEIPAGFYTE